MEPAVAETVAGPGDAGDDAGIVVTANLIPASATAAAPQLKRPVHVGGAASATRTTPINPPTSAPRERDATIDPSSSRNMAPAAILRRGLPPRVTPQAASRSEEHTSELQSHSFI